MSLLSPEVLAPFPHFQSVNTSPPASGAVSLQDFLANSPAMVPPDAGSSGGLRSQGKFDLRPSSMYIGAGMRAAMAGQQGLSRLQSRLRGLGRQPTQPSQSILHPP